MLTVPASFDEIARELTVEAARDAGVTTLVTVSEYTCEDNFAGAALVLDHLGEPDRPFTVISGDAGDGRYVTLDLLRELHAQCR